MIADEHSSVELIRKVQQLFQRISPETLALLMPNDAAVVALDAKKATDELAKREDFRLAGFRYTVFKYIEEINGKYYLIEIDNGATDATELVQVRIERYHSQEDAENTNNYELVQICESLDEAVLVLDKIRNSQENGA
jgi:hypothetical protein